MTRDHSRDLSNFQSQPKRRFLFNCWLNIRRNMNSVCVCERERERGEGGRERERKREREREKGKRHLVI